MGVTATEQLITHRFSNFNTPIQLDGPYDTQPHYSVKTSTICMKQTCNVRVSLACLFYILHNIRYSLYFSYIYILLNLGISGVDVDDEHDTTCSNPHLLYQLPIGAKPPDRPPWPRLDIPPCYYREPMRTRGVRGGSNNRALGLSRTDRHMLIESPNTRYVLWPGFVAIALSDGHCWYFHCLQPKVSLG